MNKRLHIFLISVLFFFQKASGQDIPVIPYPEKVVMETGNFQLNAGTTIAFDATSQQWRSVVIPFLERVRTATGFSFNEVTPTSKKNQILIEGISHASSAGSYTVEVNQERIHIKSSDARGLFYAVQTLQQLLPHQVVSGKIAKGVDWSLPALRIEDAPGFEYRGLMLDVSRHFMPLDFIKKMIDQMAMQKMNKLHLHLTDDQGWRMEVKKYPRLTSVGGSRNGTLIGKYPGKGNDQQEHKGHYTQEELKELVRYAQQHYIDVIPEIELPGHSSAAIAAYPDLSCFPVQSTEHSKQMYSTTSLTQLEKPGTKIVQETWGVFNDVMCPTEFTFRFIQDVMDEVMAVFPSKYIHIGGDECPKDYWKKSAFCQDLIRSKGLKDEHELQSYFIQRVEKYLNSKGRSIIGWDEILEGGLAPNATVMSWRGISGGIESAKQGHDVIMSPVDFCYLNLYQSEDPTDSIAWGGLLSLNKVYQFDPLPKELNEEQKKFIKGVQANLWTEYIKSPALAEFMLFPRLLAIAEIGWSKNKPGFEHFAKRVIPYFKRLQENNVNHSSHLFDLQLSGKFDSTTKRMVAEISGVPKGEKVFYAVGAQDTKAYTAPFPVEGAASVTALVKLNEKITDRKTVVFDVNKATGKKVQLKYAPSEPYHTGGAEALVNGVIASEQRFNDKEWLGWNGKDFEGIIDLQENTQVRSVTLRFFNGPNSWVYAPTSITVHASDDGINFIPVAQKSIPSSAQIGVQKIQLTFGPIKPRYIKVIATHHGIIKKGNPGEGNPSWLFVDELIVR